MEAPNTEFATGSVRECSPPPYDYSEAERPLLSIEETDKGPQRLGSLVDWTANDTGLGATESKDRHSRLESEHGPEFSRFQVEVSRLQSKLEEAENMIKSFRHDLATKSQEVEDLRALVRSLEDKLSQSEKSERKQLETTEVSNQPFR
jgi:hypothetical protein